MTTSRSHTCGVGSDRTGQSAPDTRRGKFVGRIAVFCAVLVLGAVSFFVKGRSHDRPASVPLITGEAGPLPYDETGEPRVFHGSPDEYEALWQVYLDSLGKANYHVRYDPTATKADEDRVSEYQSLAYSRKYQSEDALKQTESRMRHLEDQLHRSRLNPWRLWHTGLKSDERIAQEMAQVLKDRRAHEIIFRLCSDLVRAISGNYVGQAPLPPENSNRFPSYD